jgi:hypothetical protein
MAVAGRGVMARERRGGARDARRWRDESQRGVGMAGTKAGGGTGTQATDARDLVAIAELADMLWQLGAESTDAPIDVAPYLDGLKIVARRIQRMHPLDAGGRELAARHYYAGVIAGACGDDSAIARGVSDSLVRQSGAAGRLAARCFAVLARVGRRHGRVFAAQSGDRVLV